MPDQPCLSIPGQGGAQIASGVRMQSEALAPYCVTIVATTGDFGAKGSRSKVELIAHPMGETPKALMPTHLWTGNAIVAFLPDSNPGPGAKQFSIKVTTQTGETYRATPVEVTSIAGEGGYPPAHDPTSGALVPAPINA
jgi:hypothetical protein